MTRVEDESNTALWRQATKATDGRSSDGAAGRQAAMAAAGMAAVRCKGPHLWEWPPTVARQLTCARCRRLFIFREEQMVKRISLINRLARENDTSPGDIAQILREPSLARGMS